VIGFDAPSHAGQLGTAGTATVRRALELPGEHVLFCEFDRLLTWVERHPQELAMVTQTITARDCTVFGRTQAALPLTRRCSVRPKRWSTMSLRW
jgi:hypothetical protein